MALLTEGGSRVEGRVSITMRPDGGRHKHTPSTEGGINIRHQAQMIIL